MGSTSFDIDQEIKHYIDLVLRGAALCGRWSWDGAGIVTGGEDGAVKIWSRFVFILIGPQNVFANRQCPIGHHAFPKGAFLFYYELSMGR